MPNSMFSLDAGFPQFTGQESDKQKVGAIYDYLIQLQQTLRYCLQNLGGDNFNDKELEIIGKTIREPVTIALKGVNDEMAKMSASLQGFTLSVSNGKDSAKLELKAGETLLSSQEIKFEGVVTFARDDEGRSVIDGGNIFSEQLSANDAYITRSWSVDQSGFGSYRDASGFHLYVGKLDGAWSEIVTLGSRDYDFGIWVDRMQDGTPADFGITTFGNLNLSGNEIHLNGDVYVNGTKIS